MANAKAKRSSGNAGVPREWRMLCGTLAKLAQSTGIATTTCTHAPAEETRTLRDWLATLIVVSGRDSATPMTEAQFAAYLHNVAQAHLNQGTRNIERAARTPFKVAPFRGPGTISKEIVAERRAADRKTGRRRGAKRRKGR